MRDIKNHNTYIVLVPGRKQLGLERSASTRVKNNNYCTFSRIPLSVEREGRSNASKRETAGALQVPFSPSLPILERRAR